MDLLLTDNGNKSHYVYIKDFNRFMFNKTNCKITKRFCKYCLQCFSSKRGFMEYRKICLEKNDKQSIKLEKGTIKFKSYFKQIAVPLKN